MRYANPEIGFQLGARISQYFPAIKMASYLAAGLFYLVRFNRLQADSTTLA